MLHAHTAALDKHDAAHPMIHTVWRPPCTPLLPAQAHKPIAASLRLFADADNFPILVHCVHGKDRTGLIAMLLLGLLDVDSQVRPPILLSHLFRQSRAAHPMSEILGGLPSSNKAGNIYRLPHCMAGSPRLSAVRYTRRALHLPLLHLRGVAEGVDCSV